MIKEFWIKWKEVRAVGLPFRYFIWDYFLALLVKSEFISLEIMNKKALTVNRYE